MGRKQIEPESEIELNKAMSKMLVPENILADFDIYSVQEHLVRWVIELREKEGKIPGEIKGYQDVVLDGYCNPAEILSHSFSLKPVYLKVYRRRYKRSGTNKHYSNEYELSLKGVKMVPSLGIFLKEADRSGASNTISSGTYV
jgi:hypothetical protein